MIHRNLLQVSISSLHPHSRATGTQARVWWLINLEVGGNRGLIARQSNRQNSGKAAASGARVWCLEPRRSGHDGTRENQIRFSIDCIGPELLMPDSRLPEAAGFAECETLLLDVSGSKGDGGDFEGRPPGSGL
jgi:hypothetical protein